MIISQIITTSKSSKVPLKQSTSDILVDAFSLRFLDENLISSLTHALVLLQQYPFFMSYKCPVSASKLLVKD